jgi:uncharacterized protein (DUF924 family)
MDRTWIAVTVRSALRQFYRDDGAEFWRAFENDADGAMRTFLERPEEFGALQMIYDWAPRIKMRDQQRITGLLELYRERKRAAGVAAAPVDLVEP